MIDYVIHDYCMQFTYNIVGFLNFFFSFYGIRELGKCVHLISYQYYEGILHKRF